MNETEENRDERGGLCELKMSNRNFRVYNIIYMWEPKMCRLAWQLLDMLGNVLGMLRNVLGMPWQRPRHACNVLGLLDMLPARS